MTSGMGIVVRRAKELDGGAGGISCSSVRAPFSAENMLDKKEVKPLGVVKGWR